jgi:hypothetical protein
VFATVHGLLGVDVGCFRNHPYRLVPVIAPGGGVAVVVELNTIFSNLLRNDSVMSYGVTWVVYSSEYCMLINLSVYIQYSLCGSNTTTEYHQPISRPTQR